MARYTFFSFHYKPDVTRANVVKNSWVTKDRVDAGFFDSSAFEKAQKTNPDSLKSFLNKEIDGSSVVCALVGAEQLPVVGSGMKSKGQYGKGRGFWPFVSILSKILTRRLLPPA